MCASQPFLLLAHLALSGPETVQTQMLSAPTLAASALWGQGQDPRPWLQGGGLQPGWAGGTGVPLVCYCVLVSPLRVPPAPSASLLSGWQLGTVTPQTHPHPCFWRVLAKPPKTGPWARPLYLAPRPTQRKSPDLGRALQGAGKLRGWGSCLPLLGVRGLSGPEGP